ncbi:MAG: proliferating cell nuclear antigen (pcna) [Candidatus Diapherotrites archaeon]|nr:proliferating cell nuclear antigen (pcna) [Candidatus Micrarchaeota archaeon]MBU1939898.1 proliferating cell nuclear antigen (pcna) [Candidatus Micrarchaeota archaeon]
MLSMVLEDAVSFKKCIEALSVLIDEGEFIANSEGLSLKATDPSQISMVDFKLPAKQFKEFNVEGTEKFGIDLSYLSQVMARARAKDSLKMEITKDKAHLAVIFEGNATRSFSIPLVEITGAAVPTPNIEFDAEVKAIASELQQGIKDAGLISSHLSIGVDAEKFFMRANSSRGTFSHELTKKEGALLELKAKTEARSMFPLDYLANMLKGAPADAEVKLFIKKDAPVMLEYSIAGAELVYFLAPRIEGD